MALRSGPDPKATWALPLGAEHWSLTTLREKLVKIGAKVVSHGRYGHWTGTFLEYLQLQSKP